MTGEVQLTRDLRCTDVGLVLAPGAVLDLNGHALRGPGSASGWALQTEVEDMPAAPVTVRDGRVLDWGQVLGADLGNAYVVIEDVTFRRNGTVIQGMVVQADVSGSRFLDNGAGIAAWGGDITVDGSTFARNGAAIGAGPYTPRLVVTDSVFTDNAQGISCGEGTVSVDAGTFRRNTRALSSTWCGTTVSGSRFADNDVAVETSTPAPMTGLPDTFSSNEFVRNGIAATLGVGATVQDNVFRRNGQALVSETAGSAFQVPRMVVVGNTAHHNGGDGIRVDTQVEVGDNIANHNGGHGINTPEAVDLGGNSARGNATDPQCVGVVCGPRS